MLGVFVVPATRCDKVAGIALQKIGHILLVNLQKGDLYLTIAPQVPPQVKLLIYLVKNALNYALVATLDHHFSRHFVYRGFLIGARLKRGLAERDTISSIGSEGEPAYFNLGVVTAISLAWGVFYFIKIIGHD